MNIDDLTEFISWNLHELAWRKDFSIVPSVGVWCWINGMQEAGFKIDSSKDPINIVDTLEMPGKRWELSTTIAREEILTSWKQNPKASPKALYNAMYLVIDKMHKSIEEKYPKYQVPRELSNAMCLDRANKAHKARELMEKHLLEYFEQYHEGVLANIGYPNPQLHPARILKSLIKRDLINFDRINNALAYTQFEGCLLTNITDTIGVLKEGEPIEDGGEIVGEGNLDYGYRGVSKSGAEDYFWGTYLLELAKVKGYKVKEYGSEESNRFGVLEVACNLGWNILEHQRVK